MVYPVISGDKDSGIEAREGGRGGGGNRYNNESKLYIKSNYRNAKNYGNRNNLKTEARLTLVNPPTAQSRHLRLAIADETFLLLNKR